MISQVTEKIKVAEENPDSDKLVQELESEVLRIETLKDREHAEKSYLGRIGNIFSPVFEPIGIDWRGSIALITGFVAKEIVVSTMGVLYGVDNENGEAGLGAALKKSGMTKLSAFSMMIFVLLYLPCLATIAAIKQESGSLGWTFFSVFYTTFVAWGVSFAVFQIGSFFQAAI